MYCVTTLQKSSVVESKGKSLHSWYFYETDFFLLLRIADGLLDDLDTMASALIAPIAYLQ